MQNGAFGTDVLLDSFHLTLNPLLVAHAYLLWVGYFIANFRSESPSQAEPLAGFRNACLGGAARYVRRIRGPKYRDPALLTAQSSPT